MPLFSSPRSIVRPITRGIIYPLTGASAQQSGQAPAPLLLDAYPGAVAAFALHKLSSNYAGPCMRVRRSTDNAEQDIGFDANGDLDTAALENFVDPANLNLAAGFVTTWYDQSGNGYNHIQTVAANQMRVVLNGSTDLNNGKPALISASNDYFTGVNIPVSADNAHVFTVAGWGSGRSGMYGGPATSSPALFQSSNNSISWLSEPTPSASFNIGASSSQSVLAIVHGPAQSARKDGVQVTDTSGTTNGSVSGANFDTLGKLGRANVFLQGSLQAHVIYDGARSAADESGIESNIAGYYGIPLP